MTKALLWHLETPDGGRLRLVPIRPFPFRIGRKMGLELVLASESVSKVHAEIHSDGETLRLRDLGSRNGTFVNDSRVEGEVPLREGDVLHVADIEFRLGAPAPADDFPEETTDSRTTIVAGPLATGRFVRGTRELRDLLSNQAVTAYFQPIVLLETGAVVGYEALGRGRHSELPESPVRLLAIAESCGLELQLSRLFRKKAVELVRERSEVSLLFLNTHPKELERPGLIESLDELREMAPHLELALEIHESVLTSPKVIAELRQMLDKRSILLAYDDFGAGQARLLELAETPPDYLKFDSRFVSCIDTAPESKRHLLRSLTAVGQAQHVRTVAEGIERPEEAECCRAIGFTHGQGYHFGRPTAIENL